jgi:hypothetical protein
MRLFGLRTALFGWALLFAPWSFAKTGKSFSQAEWDKLLDAARKEQRIVVSIPTSAEFRKQLEEKFLKNLALMSKYSRGAEAPRCVV